jgi:parvulin-like peptidyl-prolyl isomerase
MNLPITSVLTRRSLALAVGLFLWCGFPGSTPAAAELAVEDSVLARVGDREITLEYFVHEWDRMPPSEKPQDENPLIARQKFLDDLVLRHLLAIEALRHPKKLLPADETNLAGLQEHLMLQELYRREVVDQVQVERRDLDLFVKELSYALDIRAFVFDSRDPAQAWYTRIIGGTPISRLEATAAEADPQTLRIDEIGYVVRQVMSDTLARVLYQLAPGRTSEPLLIEDGWALYQVLSMRQIPAGVDLDDPEAVLAEARQYRVREFRESYRARMADSLEVTYHEEAMDTLVNRFVLLPPRTTTTEEGVPEFHIMLPLPECSVEDSALVLAETKEQIIEARHLLRFMSTQSPQLRSEIRSRAELRAVVDRVAFDRALIAKAWALGLDQAPSVLEGVERRYEGFQVYMMYQDSVLARIHASVDTLRAFFAADSVHFMSPATAEVWLLMVGEESLADSLLQVAKAGGDLEQLARDHSLHFDSAQNGGMTGTLVRGDNPNVDLDDAIFESKVGEFTGPVLTPNGWVVFQLLEKSSQSFQSFEAALPHVNADYTRIREEAEMQAFLARVRERIRVETYPERVEVLLPPRS